MKRVLSIAALGLAAACGGAGGSTSNASDTIAIEDLPQIAVSEAPSTTFTSMLNGVRSDAGVGSVSYNAQLGTAARRHANDMHANEFFSHTGSDGSTIGERVNDAGYAFSWVGENIAKGQANEAAALASWQSSTTGHKENNEMARAEHFALAKAGTGENQYWVLVLADPL
ncbi:Cysteine-rich secretory protein family protein [Yoonia maricola]|uniref:Cysteine-rich secretory protein family protein n=1 Tax=Yoonia maricola TaxID=420999 RepID=A0A2M8W580_9RHOB|nr:CAP domain-containing protein [Yoonia maricola]PJI86084.1 Cysteine-rich secretory protein family protein [Yoonia maricola]